MDKLEFDFLVVWIIWFVVKLSNSLVLIALGFSFLLWFREHYFSHANKGVDK